MRQRIPAAALLLLTLVASGCSTSPDADESNGADPTPTTAAAQQVEPTPPQPEVQPSQPEPPRATTPPTTTTTQTDPPQTTTQPDDPDPPQTTTQPDDPDAGADDESNTPERVSQIFARRLVLWGDGFLEFGYPASSDGWDRTRLVMRVSADGLTWSAIEALPVPFADVQAHDNSYRAMVSDGQRLLRAVQQDDRVLVAITSDLTNWDTFEIVLPQPDGLPHGVRARRLAYGLTIGPDGWLLHTDPHLEVDLRVLAPADIGESAQIIRFDVPESQGLNVEWNTEQQEPGEPYFSRFVTWEELGIDEDTYLHYGVAEYLISPRTPSDLISGEVWSANWGQEPIRVDLPEVRGATWWTVVGTDAGYVGLPRLGFYPQYVGVEHEMFFSPDGLTWVAIDAPHGDRAYLMQLSAVEDGVLVIADVSGSDYFYNPVVSQKLWLGDAAGSNWRTVELPELPERSWIDMRDGGHGAVGMSGLTEGERHAQWILGTIDGVNWLVMEDSAPRDLRMIINGNEMVVTDPQGNIRRFPIP